MSWSEHWQAWRHRPLPAVTSIDDEGRVRLGVFRRGDKAEIYIALPGKDWEQQAVAIPETGDTVEVTTTGKPYRGASPGAAG
ncbi:MAG TPA: hypothetical protein PK867_10835, partial [Pirellulales bacterium]|nr:hypothetical protein [Pirellulales bacterium]